MIVTFRELSMTSIFIRFAFGVNALLDIKIIIENAWYHHAEKMRWASHSTEKLASTISETRDI